MAQAVWPEYQGGVGDYNIEQVISRLRRKLEPEPERPRHLLTVRGLGYRLMR
ncbi:MAG TPA: helix-turn-helix domain-containing protein [Dehalococcoidia bacterium]|nr:helix-turn-helix domain-containing protein [Dehalococcoidia bacterium]